MKYYAKPLNKLINELSRLPGIGGKTAQRLAFHILSMDEKSAMELANAISDAKKSMTYCSVCGNLTDTDPCAICSDDSRDKSTICVVESPKDVVAMEKIREYRGYYHVLHGAISPMDGIGPGDLQIDSLVQRVAGGEVKEVVLALSTTMEGDTTNFFIYRKLSSYDVKISVIARGVSIGDEIEYADEITLGRSIVNRTSFNDSIKL